MLHTVSGALAIGFDVMENKVFIISKKKKK